MSHQYLQKSLLLFSLFTIVPSHAEQWFLADYVKDVTDTPVRLSPDVISTKDIEYNTTLSEHEGKIYYTRATEGFKKRFVVESRFQNNGFSKPQRVRFGGEYVLGSDVQVSENGTSLLFKTRKNHGSLAARKDGNIYQSTLGENGWSAPLALPKEVNSELDEFYPISTRSGNLYFSREMPKTSYDIYVSEWADGNYQLAKPLSSNINSELVESDAYISPDESFMIFVRMYAEEGYGVSDLYISFNQDGEWSKAKNMGAKVNSVGVDGSPYVSNDGKYLFFTSTRDSDNPQQFDGKLDLYVLKFDINEYL